MKTGHVVPMIVCYGYIELDEKDVHAKMHRVCPGTLDESNQFPRNKQERIPKIA